MSTFFITFSIATSFLVISQPISGSLLGEPCLLHNDCEVKNSNCRVPVKACGSGMCHCSLGFQEVNGTCKRQIMLGFRCNSSTDVCRTVNADCTNKRCSCSKGFVRGLMGDDCISEWATERHNGRCFDSSQCYYNMKCLKNQCRCEAGYKVVDDYDCVKRQIGDFCENDSDCSQIAHGFCANNQCSCDIGYKRMQYLTMDGIEAVVCAHAHHTFRNEGERCNVSETQLTPAICRSPLVCVECSEGFAVCARPMEVLTGQWSVEWLVHFVDYVLTRVLLLLGF